MKSSLGLGSLKAKIVISVTFFHIILMSLFVSHLHSSQMSIWKEDAIDQSRSVVEEISYSILSWYMANDFSAINEAVSPYLKRGTILRIVVFDLNGKIVNHSDNGFSGKFLSDSATLKLLTERNIESHLLSVSDDQLEVAYPLHHNNTIIGWIRLVKSMKKFKSFSDSLFFTGALAVIIFLILGVIVSIILSNKVLSNLYRLIEVINDIKRGNKAARAKIDSQDEVQLLADAFDEMMDDIHEKEEKLEHTNQELEDFAFLTSHDLQAPLRHISIHIQLLLEQLSDVELTQDMQESINFILRGSKKMREMITSILQYSRINRESFNRKDISLMGVMEDVYDYNKADLLDASSELIYKDLPVICGDLIQIEQLFQNLVSNAVRYRKDDQSVLIEISWEDQGDFYCFKVKDNGTGIDPAYHKDIFKIFNRLDKKKGGTGIGLAICQKIIHLHGGDIHVESTPGVGATFIFTLPKC
jgi:signal transduction histidine kinase